MTRLTTATLIGLFAAAFAISAARSEPFNTKSFYDSNGSFAGSSSATGRNSTSFSDRDGRFSGSSIRNSDGTTSLYDARGHFTGSVTNTSPNQNDRRR